MVLTRYGKKKGLCEVKIQECVANRPHYFTYTPE